jgi:AcrR family transcriptional regulator
VDGASDEGTGRRPAHRPSRREAIIEAGIRILGDRGFPDASIEEVANQAGVAPTAIYYHFGGKDELFLEALRTAQDRFSAAASGPREQETGEFDVATLRKVVAAGWQYWQSHPEEARLLARYGAGPTPETRRLRSEWEERHVQRAYDYVPADERISRSPRRAREQHAAQTLALRTLIELLLVSQAASIDDGPLSGHAMPQLAKAVQEASVRLVLGATEAS